MSDTERAIRDVKSALRWLGKLPVVHTLLEEATTDLERALNRLTQDR